MVVSLVTRNNEPVYVTRPNTTDYKLDRVFDRTEYAYKPIVWFVILFSTMFDYNTKLNQARNSRLHN